MSRIWKICWLLTVMTLLVIGPLRSDNYVDDSYYWAPREDKVNVFIWRAGTRANQTQASVPQQREVKKGITFIEDSITRQNPDTVVRAIIYR